MFTISRRMKITAAVALAAAAGAVGLTPAAAQAADYQSIRMTALSDQSMYVEVLGNSTDTLAQIDQWSYNGGTNQVWLRHDVGNNSELVNAHSGKCLWTDGRAGDQLRQVPCDGNPGTIWNFYPTQTTYVYALRNVASGLFMDVSGGGGGKGAEIDAWPWNGGKNQQFTAIAA